MNKRYDTIRHQRAIQARKLLSQGYSIIEIARIIGTTPSEVVNNYLKVEL